MKEMKTNDDVQILNYDEWTNQDTVGEALQE